MIGSRGHFDRFYSPGSAACALMSAVALTGLGVAAIGTAEPRYATAQIKWLVIALTVAAAVLVLNPRRLHAAAYPLMGLVTVLLIVVILPFMPRWLVPVRNGATSWINLGLMNFQPSELAKIAFVLSVARYMRFRQSHRTLSGLILPFILMAVPVLLILKEPDLGTALIFAPALLAILIAAGARLTHLGALALIGLLLLAINVAAIFLLPDSMQLLKPHQRQRIVAMVSQVRGDDRYTKDIGYQQDKAMTLIGAGKLKGYGRESSMTIVRYNKLPEDHNDMIFPVIVNRWGLLGGAAVIIGYTGLIGSFLSMAGRTKDPFARLAAVGFGGLIFSQASINIGMTLGLLPITGITLPFISYGGSSLVTSYVMVGLVINFASCRPAIISRPSFEFDKAEQASG